MKAAFIRSKGPVDNLEVGEFPNPEPGNDEVVIRVVISAVNPIDVYIRSGMALMNVPMPFIPGCDFSGVIESVGNQVQGWSAGDRVWGSNQGLLGRQGTLAEKVVCHPQFIYPIPDGITFESAAAGGLVGITAAIGLFQKAQLMSGESIFISGGGGAIGSTVIQMARAVGAHVAATSSSDEKVRECNGLGARFVQKYTDPGWMDAIRHAVPAGFDVLWETSRSPNFDALVSLAADNARLILMAGRDARPEFPVGPFYVKGCALFGFAMFKSPPHQQREAAHLVNDLMAHGKLLPKIAAHFSLHEAANAHSLQESMTLNPSPNSPTGKILVHISDTL